MYIYYNNCPILSYIKNGRSLKSWIVASEGQKSDAEHEKWVQLNTALYK